MPTIPPTYLLWLGVAVSVLAYYGAVALLRPRPLPGIPYNKKRANHILGDIPPLLARIAKHRQSTDALIETTCKETGTPIAQLLVPSFRRPMVVVDDPRETEDIILRRNKEFDRSVLTIEAFSNFVPHSTLSQPTTPALKAQKRLWGDTMSTEFLRNVLAPNIHKAALELSELWQLKATTICRDQPFAVHNDLTNAALDAIYVAVMGEAPGATRDEIHRVYQEADPTADADYVPRNKGGFLKYAVEYLSDTVCDVVGSVLPWFTVWMSRLSPAYARYAKMTRPEMEHLMREATDRFQRVEASHLEGTDGDTCAMDMVLRRKVLAAKKSGEPLSDPVQDSSMLDELLLLLLAGHDSTANTMCFFVKFMESYPEAQATLRRILRATFPGPGIPSIHQIQDTSIPFLDAVLEETVRMSGTAPGLARTTTVDTTILGCPIPAGTDVYFNVRLNSVPFRSDESLRSPSSQAMREKRGGDVMHSRAARDLGKYVPERWLVQGEGGKDVFDGYALPSLGFGGGFRGCFGKRLAMLELRIIIVLLVLNFEFLPLPEEFRGDTATEKIFRRPDRAYVRLRSL